MVKRNAPAARGSSGKRASAPKRTKRGSHFADDDDMYQQPGKLMLNNPLIPPEMDEDVDDDLAFNSDDERMYGHLFQKAETPKPSKAAKKSKTGLKGKKTGRHGDDDEDEDYYDDALDAVGKAHRGGHKSRKAKVADDDDELYNYHEDGQTSDDDDDDYIDLSDMLDQSIAEEKKKAQSQSATTVKKTKKAQTVEAEDGQYVTKKRRAAKMNDDEENLFGTAAVSDAPSSKSFGSTLRTLVDSGDAQSAEEEKARLRLQQAMTSKHNLLSTDIDDITKNRLTRREVREAVKGDMKKYAPLLREMSTSKHMQFPMQLPDSNPTPATIGGIVAASRKRFSLADGAGASTSAAAGSAGSLAGRMNNLLATAGLGAARMQDGQQTESGIGSFVRFDDEEGDAAAYAPQEGHGERPSTNYMAKLKAMLSYENSRRKRLNRIKSKTYRRILRKEKDRESERRQAAFELLHPELARQRLADRLAKARAEERVTQKHKNTSVWMKRAKRFANIDENAKDAVNEQLSLHQRLMAKMEQDAGEEIHERYDADADGTDSEDEERLVDELLAQMNHEKEGGGPVDVEALTRKIYGLDQADGGAGGRAAAQTPTERARTELRAMKFMKAARDRTEKGLQERTAALLDSVRRARAGEDVSDEDGEADVADTEYDQQVSADANPALHSRKRFASKTGSAAATGVESVQLKPRRGLRAHGELPTDEVVPDTADEVDDDAGTEGNLARFAGDRKGHSRGVTAREQLRGAAQEVQPHKSTRVTIRCDLKRRSRGDTDEEQDAEALDDHMDGGGDSADEAALSDTLNADANAEEDLHAQQQYLIARAFAHDDVDEDFLKEKESQVEMIMKPEDKNQNLPGWGEWGGEDPTLNRRHQEKIAHTEAQKRIEKSFLVKSRADAALEHVIINHDGVELVPDRMTLHMIPRPFSNPAEFARSMRQPLGPEWSSALSFKERAQPRVEVRQGQSVVPLDLSLRKKPTKTKRRKTEKKSGRGNASSP